MRLLREPLFHFLLLGGLIYWAYSAFSEDDSETIVIDKGNLLTFMQYRYQAFNANQAEQNLANLPDDQLQRLIDEYVREEALYRQALALNLDKNDYIIKKRLIQKVEYISENFEAPALPEDEQVLINYFNGNQKNYLQPDYITFSHQFFSHQNTDVSLPAQQRALQALDHLNNGDAGLTAVKQDLFLYNRHYAERPQSLISSHFGDAFAEQLFTQTTINEAVWQGPFESPYGWHVVKVYNRQPAKYPEFTEVKDKVAEDYLRDIQQQQKQQSLNDVVAQYEVKLDL
ncbi:peptidyl-prolyl cis-trans isomerase [Thalassotalea sp. PS06]|uniref:peptidylprolyl isomerase n=1 Tax=Thalassotalea sp. PS06 TaxID=2594005 RepID=UPI00163DC69F|nr:peptidylprolyl isomerase [Thalassotalea sp. PS06]